MRGPRVTSESHDGHMITCCRGGEGWRGVCGEQWRGEEVGSGGNGEKAEYCEGLMPHMPTIPPSPSILSFPWTPLPWILPLPLMPVVPTMEAETGDSSEKAQDLIGFISEVGVPTSSPWKLAMLWGVCGG